MVETVYKPSRRRNGERVVSRIYRGKYRLDPRSEIKDVPLHTSEKQVAQQRLRKIVQDEQRERDGIVSPKQHREAAGKSLGQHVEAFIADRHTLAEMRKSRARVEEEAACSNRGMRMAHGR